LIATDHELGPIAVDALASAVATLRDRFDGAEVELYLATLLVLDADVWGGLSDILWRDETS